MKFCDNPLCRCHVEVPQGHHGHLKYVEANGNEVTTSRHLFSTRSKKSWWFCSICANVVALVNGFNKEENENANSDTDPKSEQSSHRAG